MSEPLRILVVCTGNICRSPVAEALLTTWLGGLARSGTVLITSAGTDATAGAAVHQRSAEALEELGAVPPDTGARLLSGLEAATADLVITMTRRQRRTVLEQAPRALRRTFTLPEAAGLLASADLSGLAELPVADRGRELARRLHAARRFRPSTDADDVLDPIGGSPEVHRQVAGVIAGHLRPLAEVLRTEAAPVRRPRRRAAAQA